MELNQEYESRLSFKNQESYSIEWLAKTLHTSVKFDTPPHPSAARGFSPYRGLMYVSSTMVEEDADKKVSRFAADNNERVCRRAAYQILRGMRKHGYL